MLVAYAPDGFAPAEHLTSAQRLPIDEYKCGRPEETMHRQSFDFR